MKKKLIINVRLNEWEMRGPNNNIPYTPDEIANDAYECYQAGANLVHVHARGPNGEKSHSPEALCRDHPQDPRALRYPDPHHPRQCVSGGRCQGPHQACRGGDARHRDHRYRLDEHGQVRPADHAVRNHQAALCQHHRELHVFRQHHEGDRRQAEPRPVERLLHAHRRRLPRSRPARCAGPRHHPAERRRPHRRPRRDARTACAPSSMPSRRAIGCNGACAASTPTSSRWPPSPSRTASTWRPASATTSIRSSAARPMPS